MYATYDCETDKWSKENLKITFKFGVILFFEEGNLIRESWVFSVEHAIEVFIDMYRFNGNKVYKIFVHNLDYDAKFLYKHLKEKYTLEQKGSSKILSLKVKKFDKLKKRRRKDGSSVMKPQYKLLLDFRNSIALLPFRLKTLGEIVGANKGGFNDYNAEISQEYIDYCVQDCIVINVGLEKLVMLFRRFGLKNLTVEGLPFTVPALSYRLFHAKNQKYEYKDERGRIKNSLTQISLQIEGIFREYYFGGRTEVLISNFLPTMKYLDFNSLYPSVMINTRYPIPPYYKVKISPLKNEHFKLRDNIFAVEAVIDESGKDYPLLPERVNKKNYYLARPKRFVLIREEYEELCKEGLNIVIISYFTCKEWEYIFSYFKEIYETRLEFKNMNTAESKLEKLCKLPMNSTYGKFAEKREKETIKLYSLLDLHKDKELFNYVNNNTKGKFIENVKEGYCLAYFSNYVNFIKSNVVFAQRTTDTDSLVVDGKADLTAVEHLLDESSLGGLKVEFEGFNFLAVSPKEYMYMELKETIMGMKIFEHKQKAKGISGGSILNYDGKGVEIVRPTKLREAVRRNMDFESAVVVLKQKHSYHDRSAILEDGRTMPFHGQIDLSIVERNKKWVKENLMAYYYWYGYLITT
jgi:hypothetical protein